MSHPAPPLRTETLRGAALRPWLPALSRLRVAVFRDWPYLYEGNPEREEDYLAAYAGRPDAAAVLAFATGERGEEVVGAATCQPMAETHDKVREAFRAAGLDPAEFCYFGESVLLAPYRGQGIGVRFFQGREAHARALGLRRAAFVGVRRDPADPRRPAGHVPLDAFWAKRGYRHHPEIVVRMDWPEVGGEAGGGDEVPHDLTAWLKDLA
ncbi:GNAT family N-acetyltransferase [Roseomonas gilardii subsp. gilardii]|uniref:GNAT family N-acetyltransferase n=1 Tax=Roseomonas gilardii TaxID=257708 RepID=UPI001FF76751|nr:GNAT family N-acetyltransferase [Roseomonas gilardii]UPG71863.1 GNAT family N-acetyltransferase [Roseomonas gilardii subsp. gilardii]